jgi:hypothetical protein
LQAFDGDKWVEFFVVANMLLEFFVVENTLMEENEDLLEKTNYLEETK